MNPNTPNTVSKMWLENRIQNTGHRTYNLLFYAAANIFNRRQYLLNKYKVEYGIL